MYDLYFYLALAVPYTLMLFIVGLWLLDIREARRTKRELELDRAFDQAQAAHDSVCNDWQPDTRPDPISRSDYERFLDQPDPDERSLTLEQARDKIHAEYWREEHSPSRGRRENLSIPGVHSLFPLPAIEEFRRDVRANLPPTD